MTKIQVYKSQIAKRLLDVLYESGPLIYEESWCGCDWGIPFLRLRLEWERYYSQLTQLGYDLVEHEVGSAEVMKKLRKLDKKTCLNSYQEHDFCLTAWHTVMNQLSDFSYLLSNAGLDKKIISETLGDIERQALSDSAQQDFKVCKNCQAINNDIKAFEVNYCPRYESALKLFMRVRDRSLSLDQLEALSDYLTSPQQYEVEFDFSEHGYVDVDGDVCPPRYDCLEQLHSAIIELATDIYSR